MKRALLLGLVALTGCDFEKALGTCIDAGACERASNIDAGVDAGEDAGAGDAGSDAGLPGDGGTLGTPQVCNLEGWCWQTPSPRVELRAVISVSPNEAWAFGSFGVAMYFDGTSWRGLPGRTEDFVTAARFGPRKFLVGSSMGLFVLDGGAWQPTSVPGVVQSVGADPSGELFATNAFGTGWFHSFSAGTSWSSMTGPGKAYAFTFPEAGRGWATSEQGKIFRRIDAGWATETTSVTQDLLWTWATSEGDAWASGQNGTLLHHGDAGWAEVLDAGFVGEVVGASRGPDDVWILSNHTDLTHWDGTSFSPITEVGSNFMSAISLSASDGWAVGDRGAMLRLQGSSWMEWPTGTRTSINSLHGTGSDDIWAVGAGGFISHFDGSQWSDSQMGQNDLIRVFALGPNDAWAVGDQGTIVHWNGSNWSPVTVSASNKLESVWVDAQGTAWIVGAQGAFWTATLAGGVVARDAGLSGRLRDVSGSDNTLFVISEDGTMATCDTMTFGCSPMIAPEDGGLALSSVYASSPSDVWVTANSGVVERWNGTAWTQRNPPGTTLHLVRGEGTPDGGVYVVGESGHVKLFLTSGGSALQTVGTDVPLFGLFSTGGTTVVGGDVGVLLRRTR